MLINSQFICELNNFLIEQNYFQVKPAEEKKEVVPKKNDDSLMDSSTLGDELEIEIKADDEDLDEQEEEEEESKQEESSPAQVCSIIRFSTGSCHSSDLCKCLMDSK